jgi:carbonic anhydrase
MNLSRFLLSAGIAVSAPIPALASDASHHWSYSGHSGPSHWAQLDSHFAACGAGKAQSPIDIHTHEVQPSALPALVFRYQPSALHLADNGHTIQVNYDAGSALLVGGKRYELVQFHFHRPSEEKIDGKRFDMVAHLVHRDANGELAVVAVPLRSGQANALVETLWKNLPKHAEQEVTSKDVHINAASLLPKNHGYYTYSGSLTTPPCSQGVRWLVLKTPSTLSSHEVSTFAARYPNNARPTQLLNGRHVLSSK